MVIETIKSFENVHIHQSNIEKDIKTILADNPVVDEDNVTNWLLTAISVIDLTTLSGDDTRTNVTRLCVKAGNALSPQLLTALKFTNEDKVTTAAVCVYPSRVKDASEVIERMGMSNKLNIAAVATGFPSGLYPLGTRLEEIKFAVSQGANEIDVVLDRSLVLSGQWTLLYEEVVKMQEACGKAHLKVILGVGELGTLANVYKASMISMMAGADFIKTSTGKESVNATLPVGLVMCRAIRKYYKMTGRKVGLKPAGGIKTPRDAINWLVLVRSELGPEWLSPELFRIGASSLLGSLEKELYRIVSGVQYPDSKFNFI